MTLAPTTRYGAVTDEVITALKDLLGEENVLTDMHERAMRAANCAPFPLHRWADQTPDVVVLPGGTEDVVGILKLANERRIPVTPRGGASGLADGAMPLRKGICVDIKRMNEIFEIDEEELVRDRRYRPQPPEAAPRPFEPLGKFFPDDLAGYANAVLGGLSAAAAGRSSRKVTATSPTPSSVWSACSPTVRSDRVGGGGTRKIRKSSSATT